MSSRMDRHPHSQPADRGQGPPIQQAQASASGNSIVRRFSIHSRRPWQKNDQEQPGNIEAEDRSVVATHGVEHPIVCCPHEDHDHERQDEREELSAVGRQHVPYGLTGRRSRNIDDR